MQKLMEVLLPGRLQHLLPSGLERAVTYSYPSGASRLLPLSLNPSRRGDE